MRVNIFAAVGFGVAVQPVLHLVGKTPNGMTVYGFLDGVAVLNQHLQQVGELRGVPVTGNVGFGEADVTTFNGCRKHTPVLQDDVAL